MSLAERMGRWNGMVTEASRRFDVEETWIKAVMRMESGGRTVFNGKPITSDAGAMGVMQVMPETYKDMREQHRLGANPYDPHDNVLAGTAYLRWLYEKYGYPKMFAAYNAGPGTLEANLAGERTLPGETKAYVSGIARILGGKAEEFEDGPRIAMLTRPDGSPISVDGLTVTTIRASLRNEFAPSVQTVVVMGNRVQGVREPLATVTSLLKGRAGPKTLVKNTARPRELVGTTASAKTPKG